MGYSQHTLDAAWYAKKVQATMQSLQPLHASKCARQKHNAMIAAAAMLTDDPAARMPLQSSKGTSIEGCHAWQPQCATLSSMLLHQSLQLEGIRSVNGSGTWDGTARGSGTWDGTVRGVERLRKDCYP